ncbi:type I 3-dehydroquinate dehydratase [Schaalia meyeri]|uniref:3-dehydroquinate dehydratase n=1 Tax=Schaalia meyeri TaxID=52773 RepID=A0AAP9Y836_9ACTO|nr:type I 3-dehydroquinate dehydratase [Schaalia meyeri]QQC44164.1 type I 3-dehydroquinate dehydratase [Schaalia meyeri]SDR67970.1 3-dehydroquinate dehydratase [Schaalia meyeri]
MSHPSMPGPDHAPGVATIGRAAKTATLGGRTQVIVPIIGGADVLAKQVAALAACRADIAEWRADTFLSSLVGPRFVAAEDVETDLAGMARYVADASPVPVLATIRTWAEGGEAYLDDEQYCALVRGIAPLAGGVDVEILRDGAGELIDDAHDAGALVVSSFHDFEGTPGDEQLAEVLAAMNYAGADVLKFACMAHSATDAARVLAAQAWAREAYDRPVIGIAMGSSGTPTRLVGSALGSAATFASLPGWEGIAPGQFTVPQARAVLDVVEGPHVEV